MNSDQLKYILALEKFMKFADAAEFLNISQPTLSYQIKKLEDELGVLLINRTTRSIWFTPAGHKFVSYAKKILSTIDEAKNAMLEFSSLQKGNIKIGGIPTLTYAGITPAIADFQKEYPGINIELHEANSDDLIKKMKNSEIDVAFITSPSIDHKEFNFYPLINEKIVLFIPADHVLAEKEVVDLAQFAREKFIMIKSSTGLRNILLKMCYQAGFQPNIYIETSHVETVKGFVESGVGVALLSYRTASMILNSKTKIIQLTQTNNHITGLAIPKNNNLLIIKTFKDFMLNKFQSSKQTS